MKKFTQLLWELPIFLNNSLEILFSDYEIDKMLFFDIETTGLSAKISSLYLIGACYYDMKQQAFQLVQYFADEFDDEKKLLEEFYQLSQKFSVLFHYNGRSFDLPYLNTKCEAFGMPFRFCQKDTNSTENHETASNIFDQRKSSAVRISPEGRIQETDKIPDEIDIYQIFHTDKLFFNGKLFPLKNKKQKTLELLAGYHRKDTLDGKELIQVYNDYHKNHIMHRKKEEEELLAKLLLHNHDDLCGLVSVCPLIGYTRLMAGEFENFSLIRCEFNNYTKNGCFPEKSENPVSIKNTNDSDSKENRNHDIICHDILKPDCELCLELETEFTFLPIPVCKISYGELSAQRLFLRIPGKFTELKFFYPDYKNYYYLPEEDMAVHKSVAAFVDKNRRVKAKPENCYTKKSGYFFPQPADNPIITPVFYEEFRGKVGYFKWEETQKEKEDVLIKYATRMIIADGEVSEYCK